MEWLKQEFVEAERIDPEDTDELASTEAHNGGATPENDAASGMSQFGRIRRKRKAKSSRSSRSQAGTTATAASIRFLVRNENILALSAFAIGFRPFSNIGSSRRLEG